MQKICIDFSYTTLLAFLIKLKYEENREISFDRIFKFRIIFRDELIKNYLDMNIKIFVVDRENIEEFKEKYQEYFIFEDDKLILKDQVKQDDLEQMLKDINPSLFDEAIYTVMYNDRCKNILLINKIKKILVRYSEIEQKLEEYYFQYGEGKKEVISKINRLLNIRNTFYFNIVSKGEQFLNVCQTEIDDLDLYFFDSDPYADFYPVDRKWQLETFDECLLDEVLCEEHLCAIFTDIDLYYMKISKDINNLDIKYSVLRPLNTSFEEELYKTIREKECFVYTTNIPEETIIFMKIIKKIDEFQNIYGQNKELNKIKYRLLYLLDDMSLNLLDENNFNKEYNILYSSLNEENDFSFWSIACLPFITDIYEKEQSEVEKLKKLAYISSYYSLTKNEDIIEYINKYRNHPNYKEYKNLITKEKVLYRIK